jgi:hypothetical protein
VTEKRLEAFSPIRTITEYFTMLSMQPQARPPVRFSRLSQTALASAAALAGFSPSSQAGFFEDSSATLETRNMYFNRDFRDGTSAQQSRRDETNYSGRDADEVRLLESYSVALW